MRVITCKRNVSAYIDWSKSLFVRSAGLNLRSLIAFEPPSMCSISLRVRSSKPSDARTSNMYQKEAGMTFEVRLFGGENGQHSYMKYLGNRTYAHINARSVEALFCLSKRPSVASKSLFLRRIAPSPQTGSQEESSGTCEDKLFLSFTACSLHRFMELWQRSRALIALGCSHLGIGVAKKLILWSYSQKSSSRFGFSWRKFFPKKESTLHENRISRTNS